MLRLLLLVVMIGLLVVVVVGVGACLASLEVNRVRTAALVPFADMLNHYRPRETKWTFDNARQVTATTTRAAPGRP